MIYPGEGKKGEPKAGDYVLAAEQTRAEAAASPHQSTAIDLARADKWEGQARTKQLPSTRTEIGAGRELIDIECMSSEHFGQLAWQFKRVSGSSGLKVQAAIAC